MVRLVLAGSLGKAELPAWPRSSRKDWLNIFGRDFKGSALIDEFDGDDKPEAILTVDQNPLDTVHRAFLNANSSSYRNFPKWFQTGAANIGTKVFDLGFIQWQRSTGVAYYGKNSRNFQNTNSLPSIHVHEQVSRK